LTEPNTNGTVVFNYVKKTMSGNEERLQNCATRFERPCWSWC